MEKRTGLILLIAIAILAVSLIGLNCTTVPPITSAVSPAGTTTPPPTTTPTPLTPASTGVDEQNITITISGIVVSGGDTTQPGGPTDTPRKFVYKVRKEDGAFVNVSYTAYPPSPAGDAASQKIMLNFHAGSIQVGDYLGAHGVYDQETNTVMAVDQGDYIFTTITEETAQKLAADFILNSSTFKFDGVPGSLTYIKSGPSIFSSFRSTSFTFAYETLHPGHGDRSGQALVQFITKHTVEVIVDIEKGRIAWAVCDGWDMVNEKELPVYIRGVVIGGGDTTPPGGPVEAPRNYVYKIMRDEGFLIDVSYAAYPPSPAGEVARDNFTLDLYNGHIEVGDRIEVCGALDKESNTVIVAEKGDYIRTSLRKATVLGVIVSIEETTPLDGVEDVPGLGHYVYEILREDGTFIKVSCTPEKAAFSLYNRAIRVGDYMKAVGTYERRTNTVVVATQDDMIKTYDHRIKLGE
jgi:hypothetical protein